MGEFEFKDSGLNGTETKILFYLISNGPRSAGTLSQNLKIKRTTIYSALDGLMNLQLILKEKVAGKMVFSAIPKEMVTDLLSKRAQIQFEKTKDAISSLSTRLEGFDQKNSVKFGGFEIQRIQSTVDFLKLLDKYIFTKDFCAIWNPQASIYSETVKNRIAKFLEKTARNKNAIKDIFPEGPKTRWYIKNIKNPKHEYRIIPSGNAEAKYQTDVADLILVEDMVLISLNIPHNESMLMIKSQPFENYMRWLFDTLWNSIERDTP